MIFDHILNRAPVAPVRPNPDLPSELEYINNRALEKDTYSYDDLASVHSDGENRPFTGCAPRVCCTDASRGDFPRVATLYQRTPTRWF